MCVERGFEIEASKHLQHLDVPQAMPPYDLKLINMDVFGIEKKFIHSCYSLMMTNVTYSECVHFCTLLFISFSVIVCWLRSNSTLNYRFAIHAPALT